MKIGGTMLAHNAVRYDYCIEIALRSALPHVHRFVVLEADSDDGTMELLRTLQREFAHLEVIHGAWKTSREGFWLADLSNVARATLTDCDWQFSLQADEVLEHGFAPEFFTGKGVSFQRLNFWLTDSLVTPPTKICGSLVRRLAPQSIAFIGDAEQIGWEPTPIVSTPRIFHYGFLRKPGPFVEKSKPMHIAYTGGYNPALDEISETSTVGWEKCCRRDECIPFTGAHPEIAHGWLRERGYLQSSAL